MFWLWTDCIGSGVAIFVSGDLAGLGDHLRFFMCLTERFPYQETMLKVRTLADLLTLGSWH